MEIVWNQFIQHHSPVEPPHYFDYLQFIMNLDHGVNGVVVILRNRPVQEHATRTQDTLLSWILTVMDSAQKSEWLKVSFQWYCQFLSWDIRNHPIKWNLFLFQSTAMNVTALSISKATWLTHVMRPVTGSVSLVMVILLPTKWTVHTAPGGTSINWPVTILMVHAQPYTKEVEAIQMQM